MRYLIDPPANAAVTPVDSQKSQRLPAKVRAPAAMPIMDWTSELLAWIDNGTVLSSIVLTGQSKA